MTKQKRTSRKPKFKSGLEERVWGQLRSDGYEPGYEAVRIWFRQPAKDRTYLPDFEVILPDGRVIYLETKGRFLTADRQKHLMIRESNPNLDIRFVFSNANQKIGKRSKTTYADWCRKNGFKFSTGGVITEEVLS